MSLSDMESFTKIMLEEIEAHEDKYRHTWKVVHPSFLENRLILKLEEYKLTKDKGKLVSLANLAMLLYIRLNYEGVDNETKTK